MKRLLLIFIAAVFCLGFTFSPSPAPSDSGGDKRIVFAWVNVHFLGVAQIDLFLPAWERLCKAIAGPKARLEIAHGNVWMDNAPVGTTIAMCVVREKAA